VLRLGDSKYAVARHDCHCRVCSKHPARERWCWRWRS
jgi:hypothetical protein